MSALDFATTWNATTGNGQVGYPVLQANTQAPAPGLETLYADGDGPASDPFVVENRNQPDSVRENPGTNVTLANDLGESTTGYSGVASDTANEGDGFEPIGESGDEFTGTFDGNGHTISGLTIDRGSSDDVGLFGTTAGDATIEAVGLESVDIAGDDDTGGLVGESDGTMTVTDASVTGTVTGGKEVGGLVGKHGGGDITDSHSRAAVTGNGGEVGLRHLDYSYQEGGEEIAEARGDTAASWHGTECRAPAEAIRYYFHRTAQRTPQSFGPWDYTNTLGAVDAPALIVHGTLDSLGLAGSRAWADAFPHGELFVVPGSHRGAIADRPDLVEPVITSFLRDGMIPDSERETP
jgi:hypothetical protein